MRELPIDFINKMSKLLGDRFDDFLKGYDGDRQYGLRRNPLKAEKEAFEMLPFGLKKVLWAQEGYYYDESTRPGRNPYHEAGAYYIQEPSAMAVAELLDAKPGDKILDLCAAPGGKSTQIAGKMNGQGLLVSNEINPQRAKILSQNIERMGIRNAVVVNHDSKDLRERFPAFFDKILVDAPCSGEGMFRKDENAVNEWSMENVKMCSSRQREILENAAAMLVPGGTLVYSTCTFSPEENEETIAGFVAEHDEFIIEDCEFYEGFDHGHPEWVTAGDSADIDKTIRLWPHMLGGEGHYAAKLKKKTGENISYQPGENFQKKTDLTLYKEFENQYLKDFNIDGDYVLFGDRLCIVPKIMPSLKGLKVVRPGLELGEYKRKRFEPAHALAMALKADEVLNVYNMNQDEAARYIHGETIVSDGEDSGKIKGWMLMQVDGYSIGWGKCSNGVIKNHYPKGLRK